MPESKPPADVGSASRQVISRQLRAMIQARGETASVLGREAGVDPGMIQRFLNEERDIRLDTLDRLADVLGLRLVEGARGRPVARPGRAAKPPRARRPARPGPGIEELDGHSPEGVDIEV